VYTQKPMAEPTDWYAHCGGGHWGTNYQWYCKCYVQRRRVKYSVPFLDVCRFKQILNVV
jgi:hypothetical protein